MNVYNDGHKEKTLDPINAIFKTSQILVKLFHVLVWKREEKNDRQERTYGTCCRLNLQSSIIFFFFLFDVQI